MAGDIYFNNVSLLLHYDGVNNSTTFVNSKTNNLTFTSNNGVITTSVKKFGTGSLGGNGGITPHMRVFPADDPLVLLGGVDWTIEFWQNLSTLPQFNIPATKGSTDDPTYLNNFTVGLNNVDYKIGVLNDYSGRRLYFGHGWGVGSTDWDLYISNWDGPTSNQSEPWDHYAITLQGSTLRFFRNGALIGTNTLLHPIRSADFSMPLSLYKGIDEFRLTKGVARYTSSFTAPVGAFPSSASSAILGSSFVDINTTALYLHKSVKRVVNYYTPISSLPSSIFTKTIQRKIYQPVLISSIPDAYKYRPAIMEHLNLLDDGYDDQISILFDAIVLSSNDNNIIHTSDLLSEYIDTIDHLLINLNGVLTESIVITDVLGPLINQIELISNLIKVNDYLVSNSNLIELIINLINTLDAIDSGFLKTVEDTLSLHSSLSTLYKALVILLDSMVLDEQLSPSSISVLKILDSMSVGNLNDTLLIGKESLKDSFIISIPTASGQDKYLAYLLSPETMSVSNYNNYNFDGCTKFNSKYLFYNSTGLYEYGGKFDNGSSIRSEIETVAFNFNTSNLKNVPSVYLGQTSSGPTYLKVRVNGKAEVIYKLNKHTDHLQTQKVDIGKGLIGRYFQFEVVTEADDFSLESIEFYPVELKRKL